MFDDGDIAKLRPALLVFANKLCKSRAWADDLTQKTIVALLGIDGDRRVRIQEHENYSLLGYAKTALRNFFLAEAGQIKNEDDFDETLEAYRGWSPPAQFNIVLCLELLAKANKLPTNQKKILQMMLDGAELNDISDELGMSPVDAMTLINEARKSLA